MRLVLIFVINNKRRSPVKKGCRVSSQKHIISTRRTANGVIVFFFLFYFFSVFELPLYAQSPSAYVAAMRQPTRESQKEQNQIKYLTKLTIV